MRIKKRKIYSKQTYDTVHIINNATKQVLMNSDLKKWGKQKEDEVSKELNKFHMRKGLLLLDPYHIKEEENIAALEHLLLLKENRDFSIKDRRCAGRQNQR